MGIVVVVVVVVVVNVMEAPKLAVLNSNLNANADTQGTGTRIRGARQRILAKFAVQHSPGFLVLAILARSNCTRTERVKSERTPNECAHCVRFSLQHRHKIALFSVSSSRLFFVGRKYYWDKADEYNSSHKCDSAFYSTNLLIK